MHHVHDQRFVDHHAHEKENVMPANTRRAKSMPVLRLSEKTEQTLTMILSTTGVLLFILTLVVLAYSW